MEKTQVRLRMEEVLADYVHERRESVSQEKRGWCHNVRKENDVRKRGGK